MPFRNIEFVWGGSLSCSSILLFGSILWGTPKCFFLILIMERIVNNGLYLASCSKDDTNISETKIFKYVIFFLSPPLFKKLDIG